MTGKLPPHTVLDDDRLPDGRIDLVAWRDDDQVLWIGVQGPLPFVGAIGCHTGSQDEPVGSTLVAGVHATVIWGYVSHVVERCEVRTREGSVVPARIVTLPPDLSTDDRAVWAVVEGQSPDAAMVGYDVRGNVVGPRTYPTGPSEVIATGEDPVAGSWTVSVVPQSSGVMLEIRSERGGGGGFGTLEPFEGDIDGSCHGTRRGVHDFMGVVSPRAGTVEIVLSDGHTVPARLFPLPERYAGPAQVYLAIVQGDRISGDVVVSDGHGTELARQGFGRDEPPDGEHSARSDSVRF
jgi:hypothetical protein